MKINVGSSSWPLFGFSGVLECMRELSHQAEDYLEAKLQNETNRELADFEDSNEPELYGHLKTKETMAHQQYAIEMPHLQRSSLLIVLMSELEKRMNLCCDFIRLAIGAKVSVEDLNGAGLDRAKRFLMIHTDLKSCFQSESWARLILFRDLRNIATHSHKISEERKTDLQKKRDKLDSSLFQFRKENFSHGDQLHLGPHCLDVLVEQIGSFLTQFEDELFRLHPDVLGQKFYRFSGEGGEDREMTDADP